MTESPEFESAFEAYPVRLGSFEGPLDLLIHLIRRNEVNIYDIPIALITDQYLQYLGLMQELNLDVAGEFLVMAATLIHIKSRMLIPRPTPEGEGEGLEEEDPISIEERIEQLLERLSETEAVGFEELFADAHSRPDLIVTFLALLEMIRLKLIRAFQSGPFGAIRVYKRARPADAPHPIHDPEQVYRDHHPETPQGDVAHDDSDESEN